MRDLLEHLFQNKTITSEQAKEALTEIIAEKHDPTLVASFLTVFRMRAVTAEELEGFRSALYELCTKVDLAEYDPIDMCGTGGDGKDTFNISTLASFVASGAGVKVAKHGNYGVSSGCGSSHVLESLGVKFTDDQSVLKRQIEEVGICYLHAPIFHPAMKSVAPIRKALKIRTIFNLLGPLANPAAVKRQVVGVFSLEIARLYDALLSRTGSHYVVLYALDGYDEVSLTGDTKLYTNKGERIVRPEDFGLAKLTPEDLAGGSTVEEGKKIFLDVLEGRGTDAQKQVVCANAALAITLDGELSPQDAYLKAEESLTSGKALESFQTFRELSQ